MQHKQARNAGVAHVRGNGKAYVHGLVESETGAKTSLRLFHKSRGKPPTNKLELPHAPALAAVDFGRAPCAEYKQECYATAGLNAQNRTFRTLFVSLGAVKTLEQELSIDAVLFFKIPLFPVSTTRLLFVVRIKF